ncbi:hypothetical protein L6R52_09895 [Myxococcota bacterium]|nr:hypothetical protein [Myxococcota bacterium]
MHRTRRRESPEDGVIGPGEECDQGTLPNGGACVGLVDGTIGGALACSASRQLDLSGCTFTLPSCGNGVRDPGEACDGAALGTTCLDGGYSGGTLGCHANCTLDRSACAAYFPSILEGMTDFGRAGWPVRDDPSTIGELFFHPAAATTFDLRPPARRARRTC